MLRHFHLPVDLPRRSHNFGCGARDVTRVCSSSLNLTHSKLIVHQRKLLPSSGHVYNFAAGILPLGMPVSSVEKFNRDWENLIFPLARVSRLVLQPDKMLSRVRHSSLPCYKMGSRGEKQASRFSPAENGRPAINETVRYLKRMRRMIIPGTCWIL